jgi:ubiquitin-like-conjugating enzyme ATG10
MVEYRIGLSPTYGIPVLYFHILGHAATIESLKVVYKYLVPSSVRPQLEAVGVLGGVSLTVSTHALEGSNEAESRKNDPVTDMPSFFVHPCQTTDALRAILPDQISSVEYLQLWLGLIGPCVGLHLPKELAISLNVGK